MGPQDARAIGRLMHYRPFGNTGLRVSALGFGCGNVGGLMVRGEPRDQTAAVARAIEAGITYFDTAAQYGNGESERNLGRALRELKPSGVYAGTKVRVPPEGLGDIEAAVMVSVEASLGRMGFESIDLIQLHNNIAAARRPDRAVLSVEDVLAEVAGAFRRLREQGKVRFFGITGLGETAAVHRVVDSGQFNSVQVAYNLLNPSAGQAVQTGFPYQDFGGVIARAAGRDLGTIGIRVMAGGALAGVPDRRPNASSPPAPIGTGPDYAADLERVRELHFLVERGYAVGIPDAALRFALSNPQLSTALVGFSDMAQLEAAIASAERGSLPKAALRALSELYSRG